MITKHTGRLRVFGDLAIDGQNVVGAHVHRGADQHLTVERDPPRFDQSLDLPSRGDAGASEAFCDALSALGSLGLTGRGGSCSFVGMIDHDLAMMRLALEAAQAAALAGEVPVGAVVFDPVSGEIIATAANAPIGQHDPTAHAEILALRAAAARIGNYRLTGLALAVTLEPCAMCAGAISHARIAKLVFGAEDAKGGAVVNGGRFFEQATCHWRPHVVDGVLGDEATRLLQGFFRARR